jgi:short-subunit dehydrogenase involved in D-alanine esterification of teichoic acids
MKMASDTDLAAVRAVQPGHRDVVLVTGGTSGIGSAIAHAMAERGHTVIVCGRDEQRLADVRDAVPGVHAIRCDVTDESEVEALLADVNERFGRLDVLVNNAGMQQNYHWSEESSVRSRVEREVALNLTSLITVTHAALPLLGRSPHPTIVNVGSGTGLLPKPDGLVYSATKAAVHNFTIGLRWELAGVRVVELVPPVVATAMTAGRDEAMATPDLVASALLRGLDGRRSEIRVGKMKAWPWLVRLLPSVATSIARRH